MSTSMSAAIRSALSADLELPADEVIKRVKAMGISAPEASIRTTVHNIKSEMRKRAAKTMTAPAAAQVVSAPKPSSSSSTPDVLANVVLVNKVVGECGGVEQVRQVAEAVRLCGGVDDFLRHLEAVAAVRGTS